MKEKVYIFIGFFVRGGQVQRRDIFNQTSTTQGVLQSTGALGSWTTGITTDYRSYIPNNSQFPTVAPSRSGNFDPQKGIANYYGSGRYSPYQHWLANSSSTTTSTNRISYLTPSASRPNAYWWGQAREYDNPVKEAVASQSTFALHFYRLSNGNKVVLDQMMSDSRHWIWYNQINNDNNLLTISNGGMVSKIEGTSQYQDNTTTPSTPFLFQTHGGIPENGTTTWRTDYARDAFWNSSDRDTYIIYRPNFGANKQIPEDVEVQGEWYSNSNGERSGS